MHVKKVASEINKISLNNKEDEFTLRIAANRAGIYIKNIRKIQK